MYRRLQVCLFVSLFTSISCAEVYELRTYTTAEGKLDALNARFRDHTVRLFQKHGMESVGYWVPTDEKHADLRAQAPKSQSGCCFLERVFG
jgi:NIPSNAP